MKILLLSDLHLEFAGKFDYPRIPRDILVLAGDIHNGTMADDFILHQLQFSDVLYVLGNHEYYGQDYKKLRWALQNSNPRGTVSRINRQAKNRNYNGKLYVLDDDEVVYNDVRFIGSTLWTDYDKGNPIIMNLALSAMNDYRTIFYKDEYGEKFKFSPHMALKSHEKSVEYIESKLNDDFDGDTIIISHHAPTLHGILKADPLWSVYATDLTRLMLNCRQQPKMWLHGHIHETVNYMIGNTKVITNPRGYATQEFDDYDDALGCNENFDKFKIISI